MPAIKYKTATGVSVPGVTTVLGNLGWKTPGLLWWANQMGLEGKSHGEEASDAAEAGTLAHAMIEHQLKGKPAPDTSETPEETVELAETAFKAWERWAAHNDFELVKSEMQLVSEDLLYGGMLDIAMIQGLPGILDLKSSKGIYPDHWVQVVAYGHLYDEHLFTCPHKPTCVGPIEEYHILQLGKITGGFTHKYEPAAAMDNYWEVFKHCLALHYLKKEIGK